MVMNGVIPITIVITLVQAIFLGVAAIVLNEVDPTLVLPFVGATLVTLLIRATYENIKMLYLLKYDRERVLEVLDNNPLGEDK